MRKVILDVDTGSDDAVAIMMAALHPDLELLACTTVWGNLEVELTTANTLRVLDHVSATSVPVYEGLDAPFGPIPHTPEPETDRSRGKIHKPKLDIPDSKRSKESANAVEWLVETLRSTTERLTLVPVAPLSNIAAALTIEPSIAESIDEMVIMGGGHAIGNVTASAEANIWHDPVAADVVMNSGIDEITIMPLDATHQAYVSEAQAQELTDSGKPPAIAAATFIRDRIAGYRETQPMDIEAVAPVHDALCIAYLIDPSVVTLQRCHTSVEVVGTRTYGRTVFDLRGRGSGTPNSQVAVAADAGKFYSIMKEVLTS